MTKSFYESIQVHGGFSGQFYDLNQAPLVDDICDSLLQNAATSNLQENAPLYLGSSGNLLANRAITLDGAEVNGRLFFLHIDNDDIGTFSITLTSSGTVNGFLSEVISSNGDYILIYQTGGDWRLQSLWTLDEKSNLEMELEYRTTNLSNFKVLLYTGNKLTTVNIYEDNTKTVLMFNKALSYTGNNLTSTILTRLSDGAVLSKALVYTGSKLNSVETT